MTEQNAHDDERDTADLATNDAADLAAGDATDLVTDDTADLAIDDTSDSAVDDASDLAAGDAADLATADAARSQPPAGQLTPLAALSALPLAPPPTFAATDRPARRARRLRWKPGITRPMMALSAASFALMIAGVGGYVSAIPAVVAGDKPGAVVIPLESALWLDGQMREVQAGPVGSTRAVGPVTIEASKTDAAAPDAASALGLGSGPGALGVASLTGATAVSSVDSSFARAQQIAGGDSTASGSASTSASTSSGGSGSASGSGSGSSGGASDASGGIGGSGVGSGSENAGGSGTGSAPAPAGPTAEQEAAAYAVLVDHQARVNDYVARVNNAVAAFNNDCMSTSRPLRQSDYNECAAIDSQTLTDFLLLRNSNAFAEGSRWQEQKGNLQRAYIALDQYLSVIYDAWGLNLAYENPAEGVDRWMEPVRADQDASGNSIAAARLNETLASIRL